MSSPLPESLDSIDREAKEFEKDVEINRIMNAFRLDSYAVLDLQPGIPESKIREVYRKKSLLIHPDKTDNPLASEAFDRLAKAHQTLANESERSNLDSVIADARRLLLRELGLTIDSPQAKDPDEQFYKAWRAKTKDLLIDDELRRRRQKKALMQEEGRQKRREEELNEAKRRKREHDDMWEETRDVRIANWRDFQKSGKSTCASDKRAKSGKSQRKKPIG